MNYKYDLYQIFKDELGRGEKLLWAGMPAQGFLLRKGDIFLIPFSIFWAGFSFIWEAMVLINGITFFALFGIPFVVVGFYILIGRFIHDSWRRKSTFYAITDERLIIKTKKNISSTPINKYLEINFDEHSSGRGTISLGPKVSMFNNRENAGISSWSGAPLAPTLEKVEKGREVYELLKETSRKSE